MCFSWKMRPSRARARGSSISRSNARRCRSTTIREACRTTCIRAHRSPPHLCVCRTRWGSSTRAIEGPYESRSTTLAKSPITSVKDNACSRYVPRPCLRSRSRWCLSYPRRLEALEDSGARALDPLFSMRDYNEEDTPGFSEAHREGTSASYEATYLSDKYQKAGKDQKAQEG